MSLEMCRAKQKFANKNLQEPQEQRTVYVQKNLGILGCLAVIEDPLDEIKPKCLSSCQDWLPDAQDYFRMQSACQWDFLWEWEALVIQMFSGLVPRCLVTTCSTCEI